MYQIILHRRAANFYDKLSDKQKNRISKAIDKLKDNPLYDTDIKKLRGKLKGKHRLKIGSFRIVYLVDKERNRVIIESIGPRGDIY
ncbi:MAG: type II toxin-antitoxin system RelE/ParE family toxin [Candidatus Hydrothermarchaeota archaeon]